MVARDRIELPTQGFQSRIAFSGLHVFNNLRTQAPR